MNQVLEFGGQEEALSKSYYPDAEITIKPMKGEWWWVEKDKWNGIFSFYNATKTPYPIEQQVFDSWAGGLKKGALLHVIVPSFEYLCRMALQEYVEKWVRPMILDTANQFTMPQLRILLHRSGLQVLKAKTGEGHIAIGEAEIILEQHYVAAIKQ